MGTVLGLVLAAGLLWAEHAVGSRPGPRRWARRWRRRWWGLFRRAGAGPATVRIGRSSRLPGGRR